LSKVNKLLENGVCVFVYGTLKRGGRLNDHLDPTQSEFIGEGTLSDEYSMYVPDVKGWFPMLAKENTSLKCKGEVFLVSVAILRQLDRVEGVPTLYKREEVGVTMSNGDVLEAYTYIYSNDIPEGFVKSDVFKVNK
jgi:gamma-glutamylcyclotransferase (GGCT)/AIG2-like uncharacterized protein YtfP